MPRGDSGAKRAIKKHDHDDVVRERVAQFKSMNWNDWTPCEMYGHLFQDGSCRDCGEGQE